MKRTMLMMLLAMQTAVAFSQNAKSTIAEHRGQQIADGIKQTSFNALTMTLGKDDTRKALQQLIDSCTLLGGGTVIVPDGEHYINGPIEMQDNVRLYLSDGAILRFSSHPDDYLPVVLSRWEGTELYNRSSMIHAYQKQNIAITGHGTIDANGGEMARWGMPEDNFKENIHGTHGVTPEKANVDSLRDMGDKLIHVRERIFDKDAKLRPCAIEFNGCKRVLIEGITLKNSPFWCIHPLYSEDIIVREVTIDSHYPNNDGCDPESSKRVLIENCTFRTGDDAIAIKSGRDADGRRVNKASEHIVIRHCKFFSQCNGLCIGSEMSGGVSDVVMHNIEIGNVKNALLFKSNLDRGGYITNVAVDSVTIASAAGALLRFETNYFGYRGGNFPSRYSDFLISNVTAGSAEGYAIYFDGNEAQPISNITVSSFNVNKANHPYYLYKTRGCTFTDCTVNGLLLPTTLPESQTRLSCDVW